MQVNTTNPLTTAVIRALYAAILAGAVAGLTAYQTTEDGNAAVITGVLAGLGVLMARGAGEGLYDQHRQAVNDQRPSDVGFNRLAPKPRE